MTAPKPSPGSSPTSPPVPTNPDGTPSYGSIPTTGAGKAVPVDGTQAVDEWNLPAWIKTYEKTTTAKPIYWGPNPEGGKTLIASKFNNTAFLRANETGAVDDNGDTHVGKIDQPQSFDTNMSAEKVMKNFAAMSPQQLVPLQQMLANGPWGMASGYVPSSEFDPQTEKALGLAIAQYIKVSRGAGKPIAFTQFLAQAELGTQQGQQAANAAKQPAYRYTDPAQIQVAAQHAAVASLGHALNADQLNTFVQSFHAAEAGAQDAQQAGGGGSEVSPDLSSDAAAFAQQGSNAQEFSNHQAQGYLDSFLSMFNLAGAHNVNPVELAGPAAPGS